MAILLALDLPSGPRVRRQIEKEKGPDEVELFLDAEGPEVLERPHHAKSIVMKKEERADDVELVDRELARPAKEQKKLLRRHREAAECA